MITYKKNIFLTLLSYQITWTFCVFGEYYKVPMVGFIVGILYLTTFFYFNNNKIRALKICIFFSFFGYIFDSILGLSKIYTIESEIMIGYLPIWFLVLWPSFTTLFVDTLVFLKNHTFIAFILGSTIPPLTYYSGIPLGIAKSNDLLQTIIIMMFFWGFFITLYSYYLRKNNS